MMGSNLVQAPEGSGPAVISSTTSERVGGSRELRSGFLAGGGSVGHAIRVRRGVTWRDDSACRRSANSTSELGTSSVTSQRCSTRCAGPNQKVPTSFSFPSWPVTGYPPEDLVLRPDFVDHGIEAIGRLAAETGRMTVVAGFVDASPGSN